MAGLAASVLRALLSAAARTGAALPRHLDADERPGRCPPGRARGLPLLAKEPLRADPTRFLDPADAPRRPLVFPTSGSSGTPVRTIWTAAELRASMAVREVRSAGWSGVSFPSPRATFSGRIVVPDPDSTGPFHRWNAVERQAYFSAFHLRAENAQAYADAFERHGIGVGHRVRRLFSRLAGTCSTRARAPLLLAPW